MLYRNFSKAAVIFLFLFGTVLATTAVAQDSTLVAFYPFNGNAYDTSGFDNHGVVYGAELTSDRFGGVDSAYYFTGDSSYIEVDYDSSFSLGSGFTFSVWAKGTSSTFDLAGLIAVGRGYPFFLGIDEGDRLFLRAAASDTTKAEVTVNTTTDPLEWNHYVGTYKPSEFIRIYKNGVLAGENTVDVPDSLQSFDESIFIGRRDDSSISSKFYHFNGSMDDIRIYNYAINDTAVQELYAEGGWPETAPIPDEDIIPNSMVAYYPFNGNAYDSTGINDDSEVSGAMLTKDRFGNSESAYSFDGTNDYINLASDFDFPERSVSIWFNLKDVDGYQRIYYSDHPDLDYSSTNIDVHKDPGTGNIELRLEAGGGQAEDILAPIELDTWYHALITVDSTTTTAYLNGELIGSAPFVNHHSSAGIPHAFLGTNSDTVRYFFNGSLDDIRIYNYVIDSSLIESLYTENGWPETKYLPDTLLAYYPFSGNANDASSFENETEVYGAKLTFDRFGIPNSAYEFDGMNDYIEVADSPVFDTKALSVDFWFRKDDYGIEEYNGFYVEGLLWKSFDTGLDRQFSFSIGNQNSPFDIYNTIGNGTDSLLVNRVQKLIEPGKWYHIAGVLDDTQSHLYVNGELIQTVINDGELIPNNAPVVIGKASSSSVSRRYFKGAIDDIHIYNYSLSDSAIMKLYQEGGWPETADSTSIPSDTLLAHYPFNGDSLDHSGHDNHPTVHGATPSEDRFGWADSAYAFDGVDDYMIIPSPDSLHTQKNLSFSFWAKGEANEDSFTGFVSKPNMSPFGVGMDDQNRLIFSITSGNVPLNLIVEENVPDLGKWHHYLAVFRAGEYLRLYVDGEEAGSLYGTIPNYINTDNADIWIGATPFDSTSSDTVFFKGSIDEIRFYNYDLDDEEVLDIYVNESTVPTDNEVLEIIPDNYELYQNYPNPFNPSTTVKFDLPSAGNVSLKVYDITGRLVSTLIDGYRTAGSHSVRLNASGLSSGVYLYQIRTDEYSAVRKFTLIK